MVSKVPKKIAIILDGNRRFAKKLGLQPWKGHEYGMKKLEELFGWCLELGIKELTLYSFSTENFNRAKNEIDFLFGLFKKKFDELLGGKVIDAYTSLGRFLPSLSYLDKEWVKGKIEQTISEKESKYWQAFMEGYLSGGSVYDDLYSLMRPHYEYGLSCEFKQHDREYLIQHICVGYLRGRENLDDPNSLFRKIIDAWRPEQIREVIGFFWMQRGILMETTEENEKMRGKIIEFWRLLYKKYKDKVSLTREDKHILSDVSKLATFLPKIETESYEWLMISSPYVHENFNSSFFIEYLDELKNKGDGSKTAKYVGDIYLKMLEKITPDYDQKHIQSIVEFLYKSSNRENAKKICNIYGTRGYEFLRDIYEKHSNGA